VKRAALKRGAKKVFVVQYWACTDAERDGDSHRLRWCAVFCAVMPPACRRVRGICVRVQLRRSGPRKISRRTNVDRHQLHDGVQFSGSTMPDDLPRSGNAADQHDNRQCQPEHVVPAQLLNAAGQLSGHLRDNVTLAVIKGQNSKERSKAVVIDGAKRSH